MNNLLLALIWIFAGSVIITLPFIYALTKGSKLARAFGMLSFFPLLLLVLGPPLIQSQMLQECRQIEATIFYENGNVPTSFRECRFKENYYGEFGEWQIIIPQNIG